MPVLSQKLTSYACAALFSRRGLAKVALLSTICTFLFLLLPLPATRLAVGSGIYNYDTESASMLLPLHDLPSTHWAQHNQLTMKSLLACLAAGTCLENQKKVVLLATPDFKSSLEGHNGGEQVWAQSTTAALRNLGYSFLYAQGRRDDPGGDMFAAAQFHRMFPDLVKVILARKDSVTACFEDSFLQCLRTDDNPYGIPAYKLLTIDFWERPAHPYGRKWTLSPEDYHHIDSSILGNTYLGYSPEPLCKSLAFIPHSQRPRPRKAYIFTKSMWRFEKPHHEWEFEFYDQAAEETGVHFVVGAEGTPLPGFPNHIENVGLLSQDAFYKELANSSLLVGTGYPWTSPTPYDALCLGIPFLNPIKSWDHADPKNRDKWVAQHGTLKFLDPPYVYNVFHGDKEGFISAVRQALNNPIESYIPEEMQMSAVEKRLQKIVETDWEAEARTVRLPA